MSIGTGASRTIALPADDITYLADEKAQANATSRVMRWKLHRTAQELLPHERVAFCMRQAQSGIINVMYSPERQSAHYQGLMACGSVWVCPICAVKISEHRRVEVEQAIERCIANGGSVYLATYTISHKRYDSLSTLLHAFLTARRKMRQGRAAQELRERFGIQGTISVREVTWSKLNGWHPHCHELVFCSAEMDVDAYDAAVRGLWQRSVEREGLSVNEHGFSVSRTYGAVADYVAKFGREPIRSPWGAATEITKGHMKFGHTEEHLTPFALLWLISQGCDELKPIFRAYAEQFKGKRQLVWSAGLRATLLGSTVEETDEELAQAQATEAVVLGQLTSEQWKAVLLHEAEGSLLEVARNGDWQQVVAFVKSISSDGGRAPPPLG